MWAELACFPLRDRYATSPDGERRDGFHDRAEPGSRPCCRGPLPAGADTDSNASHGSHTSSVASMLRRRPKLPWSPLRDNGAAALIPALIGW